MVSVDVKHHVYLLTYSLSRDIDLYAGLPMLPFGEQFDPAAKHYAGKQRDLGSIPLRFSFLLQSCGLWTLSCDFVPHN